MGVGLSCAATFLFNKKVDFLDSLYIYIHMLIDEVALLPKKVVSCAVVRPCKVVQTQVADAEGNMMQASNFSTFPSSEF